MADHDIFLYWGSGSAPCWRPMIVLEEKGLSGYGQKLVSFSDQEHKGEDIMKLNPRGQVSYLHTYYIFFVSYLYIYRYLTYIDATFSLFLLSKIE